MRRVEGLSLIELVMVIVILGILAAFIGPILFNAMRSYDSGQSARATHAKMRYAMERMSRELREVRRQANDAAFPDITAMSATSITFFKTDGTQVVLSAAGNQLNLSYVPVTGVLTDQLGTFQLAYFQLDGVTVPITSASLAFIQVSMALSEGTNLFSNRVRVDLKNPQ
jgi:prepilin-type N-terminal cleavage/methylation domain-containing protein